MHVQSTSSAAPSATTSSAGRVVASIVTLAFGAFLVWGVGFAHNDLLHNAAHDTRHSNGFPCH
ncbi:CbtB domain-containing protein [Pseudoroseomonas sp. WGS1072]|uniref:CbtB domain-containing protein n=1 Tax=Roseomonas sp. WGS1072 TaxID=3366816 RepID=UPI003BF41956